MSDWQAMLLVCALGGTAIFLTIWAVADILGERRNRRVIRRRLPAPHPGCIVHNTREPL
jgi:hypothetical protein